MSQDEENKLFQHAAVTIGATIFCIVVMVWGAVA